MFSLTPLPPATCRCVFPPWITSSTAWRLNSSLYLRAILLFTVAFILLCALVSAKLGEVQPSTPFRAAAGAGSTLGLSKLTAFCLRNLKHPSKRARHRPSAVALDLDTIRLGLVSTDLLRTR